MVAALAAGCASAPPAPTGGAAPTTTGGGGTPAARSYVGTVDGTNAYLSVVFDGTRALAYVCDGVPATPIGTTPTVQTWFNTGSDGRSVNAATGGGRLALQLTDAAMTGTVTVDGRERAVRGGAVTADAGLYRGESVSGPQGVAGWILAADGTQRGGFGTKGGGEIGITTLDPHISQVVIGNSAALRIAKVGITPIPIP